MHINFNLFFLYIQLLGLTVIKLLKLVEMRLLVFIEKSTEVVKD